LSRCLKTASDDADATWRDRSFQTVAPETGNARLPTVERRTGGTSRRCDVEDRSRRLDVMSETGVKPDCIGRTERCRGYLLRWLPANNWHWRLGARFWATSGMICGPPLTLGYITRLGYFSEYCCWRVDFSSKISGNSTPHTRTVTLYSGGLLLKGRPNQWRRNEFESGGTGPKQKLGGTDTPEQNFFGRAPPLFGSKSTISRFW